MPKRSGGTAGARSRAIIGAMSGAAASSERPGPPGVGPARRGILAAAVLLGLSGCGIRLEDDAPRLPLVPTRTPTAGEPDLVTFLRTTRALAAALAGGDPVMAALAPLHRAQADVLDSALRRAGVPPAVIDPVSSTSSSPPPDPPPDPPTDPATEPTTAAQVARLEADSVTAAYGLLRSVGAELVPTLGAIAAQRAAGARALDPGYRAAPPAGAGPLSASGALPFLAATRQAVYGIEVVAARSGPAQRERAEAVLDRLRALVRVQEESAGPSAPPTPLAYALPLEVSDDDTGARLARTLLERLTSAYAAQLAPLAATRPAALTATWWLVWSARTAQRWGAPAAPFPGLE